MSDLVHVDRAVARRILGGDEGAFQDLFDRFFPRLYRFVLARVGNDPDTARDIVQQTFCNAIGRLDSYRGEAALYTWFCQICRNVLTDHFRSKGRAERRHAAGGSSERPRDPRVAGRARFRRAGNRRVEGPGASHRRGDARFAAGPLWGSAGVEIHRRPVGGGNRLAPRRRARRRRSRCSRAPARRFATRSSSCSAPRRISGCPTAAIPDKEDHAERIRPHRIAASQGRTALGAAGGRLPAGARGGDRGVSRQDHAPPRAPVGALGRRGGGRGIRDCTDVRVDAAVGRAQRACARRARDRRRRGSDRRAPGGRSERRGPRSRRA